MWLVVNNAMLVIGASSLFGRSHTDVICYDIHIKNWNMLQALYFLRWDDKVSVTHMYHLKRNMRSSTSQLFSISQSFSIAYLHEIGYRLTFIFLRIFAFWILLKMSLRVALLMRRWQAFSWTSYGQVLWHHVALPTKGHTRTLYSKLNFETEMGNGTAFP